MVTSGILTLGDLLESIGIEYSEGFAINGELASEAEPLKDGDVITIKLIPSMAATIEEQTKAAEEEKAVSPVRVVEETAIHKAFSEDPMEDIEELPYTVPEKEDKEPHSLAYYEAQGIDLRSLPVPKPPVPVIDEKDAVPELTVILNDKPITLPPKTDGEPHTFIELMSYANIDTKNPMGSDVELTLNGREISFGEELHEGDKAVIRWRN